MELSPATKKTIHRTALVSVMAGLLYLVYLLTFTGIFKTEDERLILDAANSLILQKSNHTSQTVNVWGLRSIDTELAQPLLVAPLYWAAYHIPFVGNIHAVLLFNLFITVLTAIVLFYYALQLGYTDRTAVIGALLLGLTTIVWPYTQTFFREPLAGLMLLGATFSLDKWRRTFVVGESRHWKWLAISTLVSIVALLSKEALLIALPALVAFAYPGHMYFKKHWRTLVTIAAGMVLILVVLGIILFTFREQTGLSASRYRIIYQLGVFAQGLPGAWQGIAGYLLSPGKGLWWYSPILFLAIGAPFVLPRNRWRESWLLLMLTLWFAVIYAAIKGSGWSGGAGWGPRFMAPLTPIMMLAALPLIDRMLNSTHYLPKIALAALSLLGLLVQIGGTYVNLYSYYGQIEAQTGHFVWEGPAIWTFRWSQAVGSLLFIPHAETDILWLTPSPNWLMIGLIGVGLVLLAGVAISFVRELNIPPRIQIGMAILSPVLAITMTGIALRFAYDDPRYQHNIPELESLRTHLIQHTSNRDIIMLSTPAYSPYFSNWYKGKPIWYNLPYSPGERGSWEQQPEVISDKVEDLISPISVKVFQGVLPGGALHRGGPLWLVVDSSPFHAWSTRPPEWYLAKYSYMVGVTEFSTTVRLVEYLPLQAPDAAAAPSRTVDVYFGENIRLVGYDIATRSGDATSEQSDILGISLLWEAVTPVEIDYTVGVYLLDSGGAVALQQDRGPVGGFAPTSRWMPGEAIRDNYGFIVPHNLPSDEYRFAIAIYSWPSMERLSIVGPGDGGQGDLLVLDTLSVY